MGYAVYGALSPSPPLMRLRAQAERGIASRSKQAAYIASSIHRIKRCNSMVEKSASAGGVLRSYWRIKRTASPRAHRRFRPIETQQDGNYR